MAYLGIDPKVAYSSYRNIDDISASFDGFATTFPLTVSGVAPAILPINEQQLIINVGGVPQQPDPTGANGFKLFAGNIVFSSAPSIGETFWGVILASANYISANTRFADGSANLPSIAFASGVTTGIYSPGANQLAVATNGTGRLFVDASGRVLIGTSIATGNAKLQVNGDALVQSINTGPLAGFRNAIINGNLDIWQRGTTFTGAEYSTDRFRSLRNGTTHTATRQPFVLGQTDVPGEPTYFIRTVVSSVAGAGNLSSFDQLIEDVRTFAGQQVTFSFWAKADATKNIGVCLQQFFGTGTNSPSGLVIVGTTKVSIGTSWQKVTLTATMPSISGKTIGNDNNNAIAAQIWFDAGSDYNANTDSLGHQSGTFDIAQLQVEPGPVATPFEKRPIGTELALCQRYYQSFESIYVLTYANAGAPYRQSIFFLAQMRQAPVVTTTAVAYANASSIGTAVNTSVIQFGATATATGASSVSCNLALSAEI